jgi:hypothetical protein
VAGVKRLTTRKALVWLLGGLAAAGLVAVFVRSAWQLGEAPPESAPPDVELVADADAAES